MTRRRAPIPHSIPGQGDLFDQAFEKPLTETTLTNIEKFEALAGSPDASFLATSRSELHAGVSIMAARIEPMPGYVGAACYLMAAKSRQFDLLVKKAKAEQSEGVRPAFRITDDEKKMPVATVRAMTREYAGYYRQARLDVFALTQLAEALDDRGHIPPAERVADTVDSDTLTTLTDGWLQLFRYRDLRLAADQRTVCPDGIDLMHDAGLRPGTSDVYTRRTLTPDMRQRLLDAAATTPTLKVREDLLPAALTDQRKRRTFWMRALQEAKAIPEAEPIVREALGSHLGAAALAL